MKRNKDSIAPTSATTSATIQRCNKTKGNGKVAWPTIQRCNKGKGIAKFDDAKCHELCRYFDNLPSHLTTHILLKLPIKSLLICRCVCKIWNKLITEPTFAKLQFERAPVSLMIRKLYMSRNLYLLECDPEKFEFGSNNRVKLEPTIKLPLRGAKSYLEINGVGSDNIDCITNHHKFSIVNSCNGLLCLSEPCSKNPLVICNPATREFIRLPEASYDWLKMPRVQPKVQAGFGFQPKTNEYKVVILWKKHVQQTNYWVFERVVLEIHTLGTPSWRNVEVDPQISFWSLMYPTCVNGALHWIIYEDLQQKSILCFCFESERLQSFPSPPYVFGNHDNRIPDTMSTRLEANMSIRLGELKGFLYICDGSSFENVIMWVMKEYGIGESWTKVYTIDASVAPLGLVGPVAPWCCGLCWFKACQFHYFLLND